jgi:hypothetical protein
MKRLFLLLLGIGLAAFLGRLGWNVWETTRYFEAHGREATLVIGKRYNTERWSRPVPLKKIYAYTARLEPKYDVLIESEQEFKEGDQIEIRFLPRDAAEEARAFSMRPLVNTIRLRGPDDGSPVKLDDTDAFDRLVDRAMGPPAEGVYVRRRPVREAAPSREKPTVPFLVAPPDTGTWGLVWKNSRVLEWMALGLAVLAVNSLFASAWARHQEARRPGAHKKGFVHPTLRKIEADAPDAPSKKLTYVPKPDEEIVLPEAEKRRMAEAKAAAASAPAAASSPPAAPVHPTAPISPAAPVAAPAPHSPPEAVPASRAEALPSLAANETAPPMPIGNGEPTLKLRRKRADEGTTPATPPPPPAS